MLFFVLENSNHFYQMTKIYIRNFFYLGIFCRRHSHLLITVINNNINNPHLETLI